MKLAFTAACCYDHERRIHMLLESAAAFGISLQPYGVGNPSTDWIEIKVNRLIEKLRSLQGEGYTHVLYTDGRDSLFAATEAEILGWYDSFGRPPCIMSTEVNCWPCSDLAGAFLEAGRAKYPCAGQFMGEIPWIIEHWTELKRRYESLGRNDQEWIIHGYVDSVLKGMMLDRWQWLFQSVDDASDKITGCVLHFNGGYMDPEHGRDERMDPWWERIQIERRKVIAQ